MIKRNIHNINALLLLPWMAVAAVAMCVFSCTIQPPLILSQIVPVQIGMAEVQTDIDVIWDIDPDWRRDFWYGWDERDDQLFGPLDYPEPTTYEARVYFIGSDPSQQWSSHTAHHVTGSQFTLQMPIGWHDMLLWSNIDSPDGTQVVRVDESDPGNINASTSSYSLAYGSPSRSGVYNNPEIFYAGMPERFYISSNPNDYDYYDEQRNVYVKKLRAPLSPMVYTYLVQVVLYNNKDRITDVAERSAVTSVANGVNLHTGHTSLSNVSVAYDMRLKNNVEARAGRLADIFGGKLTTFGLCDMDPWINSRSPLYAGSRSELRNNMVVNFAFGTLTDSVYIFDVTDQMQRQAHGGVITIEIDVDTLTIPQRGAHGSGSAFDALVEVPDSVDYEIGM